MRAITSIWSMMVSLLAVVGLSGCNQVTELIVTPKESDIPMGFELQLKAEKLFLEGLVIDVTSSDEITWSSSDESIATVDENGLVSAKDKTGDVTITASGTYNGVMLQDSATIHVTDATVTSVIVEPNSVSLPAGLSKSFSAIAKLSDGALIDVTRASATNWSSSNPYVASVSNAGDDKGTAKGDLTGSSLITASFMDYSGTANLEIIPATVTSLSISPELAQTPIGLSQSFKAIAHLSNEQTIDITTDKSITWESSDVNVAKISNEPLTKGIAEGVNFGTVDISASGIINGQEVSATASLEVTNVTVRSLAIVPESATVPVGLTTSFRAEASLSDGQVVDVTNDSAVSWSSSNSDLATVSNSIVDKGLATGIAVGKVGISAYGDFNGTVLRTTASLDVTNAVVIDLVVSPKPQETLDTPQIPVGETFQFTAETMMSDGSLVDVTHSENLTWMSGNVDVATVSNSIDSKGVVTGVHEGQSLISAQLEAKTGLLEDSSELTVTPLHTLSLDISSEKYTNTVQGEQIHYIGYARRIMGAYRSISGERFLNSEMRMAYIDGGEGDPIEEQTFYFAQVDEEPISGALRYKAIFEWPDESRTEGLLEWQFDQKHYILVDPTPAKNLLDNGWDFTITVTNED